MENFGEKNKLTQEQIKEQTEKILETGEIIYKEPIYIGLTANDTFYVKFNEGKAGLFKPKSGESERLCRDCKIEEGSLYKRERAAYLVDKALNFNLVPPTVIREIDGEGIGSIQEFISNPKMYWDLNQDKQDKVLSASWDRLINLWIFDYIIFSADRKKNLLTQNTTVHAIDNGLAFSGHTFAPFRHFFNQEVPQNTVNRLKIFFSSIDKQTILRDLLSELLPADEIDACLARIRFVNNLLDSHQMIPENTHLKFYPSEI